VTGDQVLIDRQGPIAIVSINRVAVHNALNGQVIELLADIISGCAEDDTTRAVILTGAGPKAFSAGADLDELAGLDSETARRVIQSGQAAFRRIEQSAIPVMAAVNGLALGGGFELVLACSFALMSSTATLGLPEAGLGLIPGYGGTQRLARIVGPGVARFLMLTGRRIDAGMAHQLGIAVLPPTEPDQVLPTAIALGQEIAARGPAACRSVLRAVDSGRDMPLDAGLAWEAELAARAIAGPEAAEGIAAFRQRRSPVFHKWLRDGQ
jgi:enoyl-CoA hydratase